LQILAGSSVIGFVGALLPLRCGFIGRPVLLLTIALFSFSNWALALIASASMYTHADVAQAAL
jgi:hypothetical protein